LKPSRLLIVYWCVFSIPFSASAQQSANPVPAPPSALLQQSLNVLASNTPLTDITLTGTARRIAGSTDESGSATLKATSTASRIDLSLPSGDRSEIRNNVGSPAPGAAAQPQGSWSDANGSHPMSFHNLLTEPSWFAPAFALSHSLGANGYTANYIGHETKDSIAVEHFTVASTFPGLDATTAATFQRLSQIDLYLDSSTLLPSSMSFNIHPDNNMLLDIPIDIHFSDYRAVNGAQIPFHVQKFLNNGLILDLQFTNATLNTGLTAVDFGGAQ
jgi:hypothetical protein